MSASLHEKPAKRLHGRKKVLCAQKDPEPPPEPPPGPPGFEVLKRHNDSEMKIGGEPRSMAMDQSASGATADRDKREPVTGSDMGLGNETWPSLSSAERSHSGVGLTDKDPASEQTEAAGSSPPPVTPPPGYAKISRSTRPLQLVNTKLSRQSRKADTSSLKAFPPLVSEVAGPPGSSATTDTPRSSESSSKSSGGSKVFEDIRRALDYDKEKFKLFQTLSGWFRSEKMPIKDYNSQCQDLFGPQWAKIGPLVARAMPKGEKRDELLVLFGQSSGTSSSAKQSSKKKSKAKKASNAWTGGGSKEPSEGQQEQQQWQLVGSGATSGATAAVTSRIMSEEDYPSLSTASKLPQPPKTSAYQNVWNVPVHT